jgi:hypothetical protein
MERRILYLEVGKHKWRLGENGVKMIEVQPPLAGIEFDDGNAVSLYCGTEVMLWKHEEKKIVVPELVVG